MEGHRHLFATEEAMSNQKTHRVWVGVYGNYIIPESIYSLVTRWRKDGWPHKQDKGRAAFLEWMNDQEREAASKPMLRYVEPPPLPYPFHEWRRDSLNPKP